jgi:pimeloyl-ACP methyl ester carboxylesterase
MPFVEVEPGVRLYYEEFGSGHPVVFVHGGAGSHEIWEQQVYALADRYRTVTYDLRGHGQSDKPPAGHSIARFVDDLLVLLDVLAVPRCTLVCHGIGGYVGVRCAVQAPARLARLVLVSTGTRLVGEADEVGFAPTLWADYVQGMAVNKADASARLLETYFYRDPGEATRHALLAVMLQWPAYAMKLLARDLEATHLDEILPAVGVPTLVIHGVHDRKQRYGGALALARRIPGARLVPFHDSGHVPQVEEAERFNRVLAEFIEETTEAGMAAAAGIPGIPPSI